MGEELKAESGIDTPSTYEDTEGRQKNGVISRSVRSITTDESCMMRNRCLVKQVSYFSLLVKVLRALVKILKRMPAPGVFLQSYFRAYFAQVRMSCRRNFVVHLEARGRRVFWP